MQMNDPSSYMFKSLMGQQPPGEPYADLAGTPPHGLIDPNYLSGSGGGVGMPPQHHMPPMDPGMGGGIGQSMGMPPSGPSMSTGAGPGMGAPDTGQGMGSPDGGPGAMQGLFGVPPVVLKQMAGMNGGMGM